MFCKCDSKKILDRLDEIKEEVRRDLDAINRRTVRTETRVVKLIQHVGADRLIKTKEIDNDDR